MAPPGKKVKLDPNLVEVDNKFKFNKWLKDNDFTINIKVAIDKGKCCDRFGFWALDNLDKGEIIAKIPRKATLDYRTSPIHDILSKVEVSDSDGEILKSKSHWVQLVLAIAHELQNTNSFWKSYLDLFFKFTEFKLPMFWSKEEVEKELLPTGIYELVGQDILNMKTDYDSTICPFVTKHRDHFKEEISDELFKRIVAFIMSYSFTENKSDKLAEHYPVMVPVADIFNHSYDPHVKLEYYPDHLEMVAIREITKDTEIFNSFGDLSNAQLLHTYGFAYPLEENDQDTVDIPPSLLLKAHEFYATEEEMEKMDLKLLFLKEVDMLNEDRPYLISNFAVHTDEELFYSLKILFMSGKEFQEYRYKDVIEEAEDEHDPTVELDFDNIYKLPQKWKNALVEMCKFRLNEFDETGGLEEHEKLFSENASELSWKQRVSAYVRHGQLSILDTFMSVVQSSHESDENGENEEVKKILENGIVPEK